MFKNKFLFTFVLLAVSLVLNFFLTTYLSSNYSLPVRFGAIFLIIGAGAAFVIQKTAGIIEETTEVLSEKTQLAGGVLQSIGTAFPDMVLGIVAAITSLGLRNTDYSSSINYAIIAAATTFGSNIYNIGYGAWCIFRQNLANKTGKEVYMFPRIKIGQMVKPMSMHKRVPNLEEVDTAIDILNVLSILSAATAVAMVLFGSVKNVGSTVSGDLYQLIRPVGVVMFAISVYVVYFFRKNRRIVNYEEDVMNQEHYFRKSSMLVIWLSLIVSGGAILFTAEAMVHAVKVFSDISGIPSVITGVIAGIMGCLGEVVVIHNFTINPNGRIGDAVTGIAMDNIVTIAGASVVAILGGVFLGGNALILIFVLILCMNTVLIWQISRLKNYLGVKN